MTRRYEEAPRKMDQQDPQPMNAWKSGDAERQTAPVIVEVAKGMPSVHSGAKESAFNERWQGVLKRSPANQTKRRVTLAPFTYIFQHCLRCK